MLAVKYYTSIIKNEETRRGLLDVGDSYVILHIRFSIAGFAFCQRDINGNKAWLYDDTDFLTWA